MCQSSAGEKITVKPMGTTWDDWHLAKKQLVATSKNSSKAESPDSHSTAMLCIAGIYDHLWMLISSK
jgi:isochorismate hydrolase